MNGLSQLIRKLWIEGQLQMPILMPYLHEVKEFIWMRPYLTIHRLQGRNQGGPLTIDCVGLNNIPSVLEHLFTDYRTTLFKRLFTDEPSAQEIGRLPLWQKSKLINYTDSDLTIVLGNRHFIRYLYNQNGIVIPCSVTMVLNVQGDWEEVIQRVHKSVRQNQLRLIRKFGYESEMSRRKEDFDLFYHQMYKPTVLARHGRLASPMSVKEAYQNFQHGCLHLVKRNHSYVGGTLCYLQGDTVIGRLLGVINADAKLIEQEIFTACYYEVLHWANQRGYKYVSFGDCAPFLADGLFQYKRRWGAIITYTNFSHHWMWLKINQNTPAVRQFFKNTPLIVVGPKGRLQGLIVIDDVDPITAAAQQEWQKLYATPGLDDLLVRPVNDLL
jgi:hypothetical protein